MMMLGHLFNRNSTREWLNLLTRNLSSMTGQLEGNTLQLIKLSNSMDKRILSFSQRQLRKRVKLYVQKLLQQKICILRHYRKSMMISSLHMIVRISLCSKKDKKSTTKCFRIEKRLRKRESNKQTLSLITLRSTSEMVIPLTLKRSVRELKRGSNSVRIVMRSRKWRSK